MKKKNATTFAFLLNYLNISSIKLANYLKLERSSISKWKSGARELKENSQYISKIADFFVLQDSLLVSPKLNLLFSKIYDKEIDIADADLKSYVMQFLLSKNIPNIVIKTYDDETSYLYKSEFLVYRGKTGRKAAVSYLLNYLADIDEPSTLCILDKDKYNWLTGDADFATYFFKQLNYITNLGHTLVFIYYNNNLEGNTYSEAETYTYRKNIYEFYIPGNMDNTFYNSLYLIKDKLSMIGFESSNNCDDMFTSIFTDNFTVMQHQKVLETYYSLSKPVYDRHSIKNSEIFVELLEQYNESLAPVCYVDTQLAVSTMPKGLLEDILSSNKVIGAKKDFCLKMHERLCRFLGTTEERQVSHQLYFINDIERDLAKSKFINYKLTNFAGKKIYVTKEQNIRHLKYVAKLLKTKPNINISLSNSHKLNLNDSYASLCKKDVFMAIIDYKASYMKISSEKFMTDTIYNAYEKYISLLPVCDNTNTEVAKTLLSYTK